MNGWEWIISGTQVLSQRGSDLSRSIYTHSLWIRPRECHTAAQSSPLVASPIPVFAPPLESRVPLMETRKWMLLTKNKITHARVTHRPSSCRLMLRWCFVGGTSVARKAEWGEKTWRDEEALGEDDREKVGQCCMLYCRCVRFPGTDPYEIYSSRLYAKPSTSSHHCCITQEISTSD